MFAQSWRGPTGLPRRGRGRAAVRLAGGVALALLTTSPLAGYTPGQAKRVGPGPFAFAPIVQGDANDQYSLTDDLLSFPRGGSVGGTFAERFDGGQGSVVLWWTPEFDSAALTGPGDHYLWYASANYFLAYEYDNDRYNLTLGGQSLTVATALSAGTTYSLVARWDCVNTLDGTNYVALSIDDAHTLGVTTAPTPSSAAPAIYVGSDGATGGGSGIVEGFAVYRRPLFDGTAGIDVANGDEISQIHSAGSGQDPTSVTGSWDVVFCLPTDSQSGALVSGSGEAWSHPHRNNLIPGLSNRGGFMMRGAPAVDGWLPEGAPTVALLLPAEKVFAGGYKTTSAAINQGLRQDIAVAAGDDWVARAVVHSDGTCQPTLLLYDQTGGAPIGSVSGTTTSIRSAPDALILAGEAPAGSTTLRVKLVNSVAAGTCFWHQAEVLANAVNNPSMQTWQATTPVLPSGWTNESMDPGAPTQEAGIVHSGTFAFRFQGGPDSDRANYALNVGAAGDFYGMGVFSHWLGGQAPFPFLGGFPSWVHESTSGTGFAFPVGSSLSVWKHTAGVARRQSGGDPVLYAGQFNAAGDFIVDDLYAYPLTSVTLTVTPASITDSLENTNEVRVDGRDVHLVPGLGGVGTLSGTVSFDWRPRHGAADAVAFSETGSQEAYLVTLYGDADNWIEVLWESPNTIRMRYRSKALSNSGSTWNATGAIVAGTKYTIEVAYAGGFMTLKVDGTTRINTALITGDFGVAPDNAYYGSDSAGANQGDATFSNVTTTAVTLQSFDAVPRDTAVELLWRTGSELDNLGFYLYRSVSEAGPWARVTPSLIPGLGSSPEGAFYSFRDAGLTNDVRYSYRLEDIDTSSVSTFHGPVSATPSASAPSEDDHDKLDDSDASGEGTAYGAPGEPSFRVVSRTRRSIVVELTTPGFLAEETPAGARVSVPGFDARRSRRAPAVPLKRALLDGVVGRRARIVWAKEKNVLSFPGLTPAAVGGAEIVVRRDGTVRPRRRGRSLKASRNGVLPRSAVRIAGDAFIGEAKKLALEMSPIRYDTRSRTLLLARTLRVKLAFDRKARTKETGRGSWGRRRPRSARRAPRETGVLAHLHTSSTGLHAVSFEALSLSGSIPLDSLRLSLLGEAVPFHVKPRSSDFGRGSVLFFHAASVPSSMDFSSETTYALERASGGVRMGRISSRLKGLPRVSSAPLAQARFETNRFYQPGLLDAPDIWLWDFMVGGMSKSVSFSVEGLDSASSEPAQIQVVFQGASEADLEDEHHLSVSLNGTPLGETSFDGKLAHVFSTSFSASLLLEGENSLTLTNLGDTGAYSFVFLDRVDLVHPQTLALRQGRFEGLFSEEGKALVSGTASYGVDVTDPGAPRWLRSLKGRKGTVRFKAEAGHRYLLASSKGLLAPRVSKPVKTKLRSQNNQADYVVIAPKAFLSAAQPLLERRQDQGLTTKAVSFEQITSEFGFGRPSAQAIRDFLAHAFHNWTAPSVKYVLLLGDASSDPRNFTGRDEGAPLPAFWAKTSYLWTSSDPTLAAVNGEDGLPDLAIGRLPATTVEEAHALVQKVLAWEDGAQDLSGKVILVADNPDIAGDFEADIADIRASFLGGTDTRSILLRQHGANTRSEVLGALDQGASILSYVGHGGPAVWASENVLNSWDPPSLLAQSAQPLMLTFNCLNGYFVAPNYDSLAEAFMKAEGRGTIGAFSPSGLSLDGPAHRFHRALMGEIVGGEHERLGDAVLAAQAVYAETGMMPELLAVYHLFGDPGMRIR